MHWEVAGEPAGAPPCAQMRCVVFSFEQKRRKESAGNLDFGCRVSRAYAGAGWIGVNRMYTSFVAEVWDVSLG